MGMRYISQLSKRWGARAPRQFLRMYSLHRVPFGDILNNVFDALDDHHGHFCFPTVAAVAKMRPDLVRRIVAEGHEVASHGYNHLRYPTLTPSERKKDLMLSLQVYRKMGIEINGFRAPYDNYTDDMPELIESLDFIWDGGFGFRPQHREKDHFFNVKLDSKMSSTTYIPLNIWSDDKMIDGLGMGPEAVATQLKREIKNASTSEGVVMFDLHPIRIGQPRFVGALRTVMEYAAGLGGWCPNPVDAVTYWKKHGKWKGDATFCLLLTGDIDNWVFADYLRRYLWRRMDSVNRKGSVD